MSKKKKMRNLNLFPVKIKKVYLRMQKNGRIMNMFPQKKLSKKRRS
jgi:hypothetical protein